MDESCFTTTYIFGANNDFNLLLRNDNHFIRIVEAPPIRDLTFCYVT